MDILVCGATGFVGKSVTTHLLRAGHRVRALTRSPDSARRSLGSATAATSAIEAERLILLRGDVTDPATLAPAVADVDAVVQAAQFKGAPVENPKLGLTYDMVDRGGTVNLLEAIESQSSQPHFLYMSGITVDEHATGPWNVAKWRAEEAIRASGLPWTIVRSCWAYGQGDKALNRLLGYSDYLPFLPVFGDGHQALTPVFVQDIGSLFVRLVENASSSRNTLFNLGGPDEVTLDGFLRAAMRLMERRRPILHIPVSLGRTQASLLQHLPGRPLTPDAVDFVAQAGAITDDDRRLLGERFPGYRTTPLEEGLGSYLGP